MNHEEKVNTNHQHISCDGGENGHPLIYLTMDDNNQAICPYCGKVFIYDADN